MTHKTKTDRVIEWLTCHHLYTDGGYPHDYEVHADGTLYLARFDEGKDIGSKTRIDIYNSKKFPTWYNLAARYIADSDEGLDDDKWPEYIGADFHNWNQAFYDTADQAKVNRC